MKGWTEGEIRWIALEAIGERYRRYRLPDAAAEAAMAGSLGRYGQLSPLAVCLREERLEVLDGFKRVAAGRTLPAVTSLQARLVVVDEPTAKAIILGLNGIGGRLKELEEAWIVQALVREDGLSQLQVADLLQRHKSWVCRRLALLERGRNYRQLCGGGNNVRPRASACPAGLKIFSCCCGPLGQTATTSRWYLSTFVAGLRTSRIVYVRAPQFSEQ
jgi:hypothetical protein